MTLDPQDLIALLTPQHTGTHFARMLLESHSRIAFCVKESRRIDADQRPGYRLTGDGDGPRGSPNETMLDSYVVRHFHGQMSESDFVGSIRYCVSQYFGHGGDSHRAR